MCICSWADECGKKFINHDTCEHAKEHEATKECQRGCDCGKVFGKVAVCQ